MLYDGILGYHFDEVKDEDCTYVDKARRVITMPSSEVNGIGDGNVTLFFDLMSGNLITIAERLVNDDAGTVMNKVQAEIDRFNSSQSKYIAYFELSDDMAYVDVSVTTVELYQAIKDAYE